MCIHVQLSVSHALYLVSSLPSSLTISLLSSHPTPPKAASGHEKFYRCELADLVWLAFSVFVHVCVCACVRIISGCECKHMFGSGSRPACFCCWEQYVLEPVISFHVHHTHTHSCTQTRGVTCLCCQRRLFS